MLNRLQSLFNRLAGVSDSADRVLSGYPSQSLAALEKPACWRRRIRKLVPANGRQSEIRCR
jgi:hypothetical protein